MLTKKCENCCPVCGATDPDIKWYMKDICGDEIKQGGYCKKCDCEFAEYYAYKETEYELID